MMLQVLQIPIKFQFCYDFLTNQQKKPRWTPPPWDDLWPDSVAPLWLLPGVMASTSSWGSSPTEKEALLGPPSPEVSSPSLSAEMANLGSRPERGPWFRPSESVEWDSDGLVWRQTAWWGEGPAGVWKSWWGVSHVSEVWRPAEGVHRQGALALLLLRLPLLLQVSAGQIQAAVNLTGSSG